MVGERRAGSGEARSIVAFALRAPFLASVDLDQPLPQPGR